MCLALRVDRRGDEARLDIPVARWARVGRVAGKGGAAHGAALDVVQVEGAGGHLEHVARFAGEGVEQFLLLELGDEGLAGGDEGLELTRLGLEVAALPEPLHHAGGFGGEDLEQGEIVAAETADPVALEVDDADHGVVVLDRRRHLAAGRGAHRDVARFERDVGDQQRAAVENAPAGDAVAELEIVRRVAVAIRTDLHLGLEASGVGAQEADRAGVGREGLDEQVEHRPQGDLRIVGPGDQRGEGVKDLAPRSAGAGGGGRRCDAKGHAEER